MNKKGFEISYHWVGYLFLAGLVILSFLVAYTKIDDPSLHIERTKVRDIALTRNAALLSPEKLNLTYNIPKDYQLEINKEQCIVYLYKHNIKEASRTSCIKNENLAILDEIIPDKKISNLYRIKNG